MFIHVFKYNVNAVVIIAKNPKTCKYFMHIFQKSLKPVGFTLIELLVVITLIGIITLSAMGLNFNKKTDIEKRDRFVQEIVSLLDKAKTDAMIGRWVLSGGKIINPDSTKILLSTGSLSVQYWNNSSSIGTWEILSFPFYGDTGYNIQSITSLKQDWSTGTNPSSLILQWSTIDFDASASGSVVLDIQAGYHKEWKIIHFDKRTWKIDVN